MELLVYVYEFTNHIRRNKKCMFNVDTEKRKIMKKNKSINILFVHSWLMRIHIDMTCRSFKMREKEGEEERERME